MQLTNLSISITAKPTIHSRKPFKLKLSLGANSPESYSPAQTLQSETLKALEWSSICNRLSVFTSTSMGFSIAKKGEIPMGKSRMESQRLLDQTVDAANAMKLDLEFGSKEKWFDGIEDVNGIVGSAVKGELLNVRELCALTRTLRGAAGLKDKLVKATSVVVDVGVGYEERYSPLLQKLEKCNFHLDLEQKIGYCIDCNLSMILGRASDKLENIRSERKRNMENLDSLLKEISSQLYRAGGIDRPFITRRRSRMCVGIRASHKHLLPGGIILDVSSSGVTYFMEPKDAIHFNNSEVRYSNAERAEERAILSVLTSEVAESSASIHNLLNRILEIDLAFARAAYGQWMIGVCPTFSSIGSKDEDRRIEDSAFLVEIEGLRHPLLIESSIASHESGVTASNHGDSFNSIEENGSATFGGISDGICDFPVPIDIKINRETKIVIISGPNTGGKTASMKSLGLVSLMSKAGMFVPAKNQPRLPWFDLVLADIGDHQSLEQNLSTFSGHILRICKMLEVASEETLVLIDEIGSGTDPAEGIALSTSILQYLVNRVNLAVVTTHYADLSRLKEHDIRFGNAAMEFCLDSLQPTYKIIWGSTGDSNALSIAKSVGFDREIIDRAQKWVEKLMPERQKERRGLLHQSLLEEKCKLEDEVQRAASFHAEVMGIFHEIQNEARDLDWREMALKAKETKLIQQELKSAKSQMDAVVNQFESRLKNGHTDQLKSLIRKSESAIASIVEAHCPVDAFNNEMDVSSYIPQIGERVRVKGFGDKCATVLEESEDDETVLVQHGKLRVRVKKSNIKALSNSRKNTPASSVPRKKKQVRQNRTSETQLEGSKGEDSYGPLIQTSKNTVDLRGMRVEEASHHLEMAISSTGSCSVLFVVHGMGTGVVKERAHDILKNNPRVVKYEQDSPLNYGCTVAYIK